MIKLRVTSVLMIALALGGLAVKFSNRTASADNGKGASIAYIAGLVPTSPATAVAMPGVVRPDLLNPFAALQSPLLATATVIQGAPDNDGGADLSPINKSGIRALINVQKIGRTETVTGFATGLDPYKAYVSLFYDAGSPGSGPCACIPSNPPPPSLAATCKTTNAPAINFSQMVIGYWLPLIGSSTRTLQILKAGGPDAPGGAAFVELEKIGAISVREDTQLGQPLPAAPDPGRFQLRACGKFRK